jgi:hypothetical protein
VSGGDLLHEAAEELYSSALEEFVQRRGALAARARAAGDTAAAKKIAGLRKPTRSAWVLNQLVRSSPGAASQLAELGAEFRAAQTSLDGAAIRELSVRRRKLIDALARQAFTITGQRVPPAALADEVTATLAAALADPQIAGELQAGTLERAVRSDGFGPPGAPAMTFVRSSTGSRRSPDRTGEPDPARPAAEAAGAAAGPKTVGAAAQAKAARERHRRVVAEAERAVAEADEAADVAARAERERESAVSLLEEQLADARSDLSDARLRARRALTRQRYARQALERLRQHQPAPAASHPPR